VRALTVQKENETPEAIMEIQTLRLRDLALSDSGFVFDPMTGHSFTVNPSGLRILQWLKDGMTSEEVVGRLADTFELEPGEDPGRDVQDFVMQLRECGLVR
jgi:PqqD family protein of HPr-rel-A system